MKYFIKRLGSSAPIGPYSVAEIEARLKTGELSADALATADNGESPAQAPVWFCIHQIPELTGNPPMPGLDVKQQAIYPVFNQYFSDKTALEETVCPACAQQLAPGVTACPACSECLAPPGKKAASPLSLVGLIVQVPGGVLAHFASFVLVCGFVAILRSRSALIFVALIHCLAWIALGIRMKGNPAERGFAFGIFIGVGLTALLTSNCSMK